MAEIVESEMEPTLAFTTTAEEVVTEMAESEPATKVQEVNAEVNSAETNVATSKNNNKWTSFSVACSPLSSCQFWY